MKTPPNPICRRDIRGRPLRYLLLLPILFALADSAQTAQEEQRGWGSSWTVPQTKEEKEGRELGNRLQKAIQARDWAAVDRILAEGAQHYPKSPQIPFARAVVATARHRYDDALSELDRTLPLLRQPSAQAASSLYVFRSYVHQCKGDYRAGRTDLERSISLNKNNVMAHNNYAWLLATCPDASVRDGRRAVEFARAANRKTSNKFPWMLDTLAAAEAESGDFRAAIKDEQRALSIAGSMPPARRNIYQEHLQSFQHNQAVRTPPTPMQLAAPRAKT